MLRTWLQFTGRFQNRDAGPFSSDQRSRDVESILRQKLIKVVSRDTAWYFWKSFAHPGGVFITQTPETFVDLAPAAALRDDRSQFHLVGTPHAHARSIVEENVEFLDIIDRLSAHQRVHATRVVADHPAERAATVRGWVGSKGEFLLFRFTAKRIEYDSRLYPGQSRYCIKRHDGIHVL